MDEYMTLNSSKYNNLYNPRANINQNPVAGGGYNYYPQNLNKRVQINNSAAVPLNQSNESLRYMTKNNYTDGRIQEQNYRHQQPYNMTHDMNSHIDKDDLILDIKFKNNELNNRKG